MKKIKRPLCPYCGEEWEDEAIYIEDVIASSGCDTCEYGAGSEFTIKIYCSNCEKLMYVKEGLVATE